MTQNKYEIMNDIAQKAIEKISNKNTYRDRANNWYSHFEEVEKDIKEYREILDAIERSL